MRETNRILIVGAGGSLGTKVSSKLVHQDYYVVGVDTDENNLAHIQRLYGIPTYLEDVQDTTSLIDIINEHDIELVVNTAAMKHVKSCETNIEDAININILANLNLVRFLYKTKRRFIYISSDKAIKPCNIYALSKQFTDYVCKKHGFKVIRGVNFLNSRGSVIDIWEHQRLTGRSFSLVQEPCSRYFITLGQMASLVYNAIVDENGALEYNPPVVYKIAIHDLFDAYRVCKSIPEDIEINRFSMPAHEKIQEDLNFDPQIVVLSKDGLIDLVRAVSDPSYIYSISKADEC